MGALTDMDLIVHTTDFGTQIKNEEFLNWSTMMDQSDDALHHEVGLRLAPKTLAKGRHKYSENLHRWPSHYHQY